MSSIFGLDESNRLVHVEEVPRGLACQCRCVVCREPLVARQGEIREHHFAHQSNTEVCLSDHESLLHRFAKRCIVEANGLLVPMNPVVAQALGLQNPQSLEILMACQRIDEELTMGNVRPDLLVVTTGGVAVAVEIAYASFCDPAKQAEFKTMALPAVEIDLSAFTPEDFDPRQVKAAVIESLATKTWLWPTALPDLEPSIPAAVPAYTFLPEELIDLSGRWISIKSLPSGDIAMKAVRFDPDIVALVRSVARANDGYYQAAYKTWIIRKWRAAVAREFLRQYARDFRIGMLGPGNGDAGPLSLPGEV
jgi:competence protein CoiA